jgi:hypothetical protein
MLLGLLLTFRLDCYYVAALVDHLVDQCYSFSVLWQQLQQEFSNNLGNSNSLYLTLAPALL